MVSGLVTGFGNLAKIIFGKDNRVFFLGSVQRGITDVQQIGAEREMRSVLLQDAEGKQAGSLRAMNAFAEIGSGEFFPLNGELRWRDALRGRELGSAQNREQGGKDGEARASCHRRIFLGRPFLADLSSSLAANSSMGVPLLNVSISLP